jgi:hypothetical protein
MIGFPIMGLPPAHHSISEREAAMGKVGRWVTDRQAGASCTITLDGGDTVIINHAEGGFKGGWLRIERVTTPLGAFVKYLQTCRSVDEVKATIASLTTVR